MAERPVILMFGSSNEAGFAALLDDVPVVDMTRWLGAGGLHPPIPSTPAQRPYEVRVPGIRVVTPVQPHSRNVVRKIVGVDGGPGTLDYAGEFVGAARDTWIYIRTNRSGQGELRKVVSDPPEPFACNWMFYRGALLGGPSASQSHRLVLDEPSDPPAMLANWPFYRSALLGGSTTTTLADILRPDAFGSWGTVCFLLDSSTLAAVDQAQTTITKTPTAPAFTADVLDRDVVFFHDNAVRQITAWTPDSITVDRPFNLRTWAAAVSYVFDQRVIRNGVVYRCVQAHEGIAGVNDPPNVNFWTTLPASATGFCVLTGQDSCETLAELADPTKVRLHDLTFYLDEKAPVFLTGLDRYNGDATPFQSPLIAYGAGPTINAVPELGWQVRSELQQPLVVVQLGISASMMSPFLQGSIESPEPIEPFAGFLGWFHDVLSLDFHPSSPSALFQALANEITAAKLLLEAEGHTAKFVGIFINLFDNDPIDEQRAKRIGANTETLRDAIWARTGQCPFIMCGPGRYGGLFQQLVYDQLFAIQASNVQCGVVDMREGGPAGLVFPDDWAPDLLHFSATGQIKKARGSFDVWKQVLARIAADALPQPVDTSPAAIIARIDEAILNGVDVLSFPGNGGQITLRGFDEMMRMRKEMVRLAAAQNRLPRRTLARFS